MPLLIPPFPFFEQFTRKIFPPSLFSSLSLFLPSSSPLPLFLLTVRNNISDRFSTRLHSNRGRESSEYFAGIRPFPILALPVSGDFANGKTDFRRLVSGGGAKMARGQCKFVKRKVSKSALWIGGRGSWILNTGAKRVTRDCNLRNHGSAKFQRNLRVIWSESARKNLSHRNDNHPSLSISTIHCFLMYYVYVNFDIIASITMQ